MEGWDGTNDGRPSELTRRRWRNFGRSGAAWIWGGEAVAVCVDGRANPNQLALTDAPASSLEALRHELLTQARAGGGEPFIGLQLTHSGRWSRPRSTFLYACRKIAGMTGLEHSVHGQLVEWCPMPLSTASPSRLR